MSRWILRALYGSNARRAEPYSSPRRAERAKQTLHNQARALRFTVSSEGVSRAKPLAGLIVAIGIVVVGLGLASVPVVAQQPQPYTPPRTPDGQPDLQGIWQVLNTAEWDIQDHAGSMDVPTGKGVVEANEIPYQPWALEQKQKNWANRATADQNTKCYMPGVPRITYKPFPFQIFQTREYIAFFYGYAKNQRIIRYGTEHLEALPFWMGDSRARWEGNTLVVDVVSFNDMTWFDRAGNFHSDALHVVERYTPTSPDHILYEVTIEDPKVFTRPWKMSMYLYRRQEKDVEILEYECYGYQFYDGASKNVNIPPFTP